MLIAGLTDGNDRYAPRAKVSLPPGAGRIHINFTALSFADPARIQFRYRRLAADPDWVESHGEHSASHTGLAMDHTPIFPVTDPAAFQALQIARAPLPASSAPRLTAAASAYGDRRGLFLR